MEVSKQDLAFAQQQGFFRLRFFDLYDQTCFGEDRFGRIANFRAGFCVVRIGIATTRTRAGSQQHAMTALDELIHGGRQQPTRCSSAFTSRGTPIIMNGS